MRAAAAALALLAAVPAAAVDVSIQAPRMKAPLALNESYRKGLDLDLRGDHAAAAEAFRVAALTARLPRAEFHYELSLAIARLREVVRRTPDSYDDHFNLGVNLQNKYWAIYLDLGIRDHRLFTLAEHHFRRAMRLAPVTANPLICLAALYAQAGDRARAKETVAGLSARPVKPSDFYNLAFYYKVMGDMDAAYAQLKQAFQHDGRHRAWVRKSDDFAEYRKDPRLQALMQEPPLQSLRSKQRLFRLLRLRPRLGGPSPKP